tara:strand:- start:9245 stop:9427 length:183 start_codon:yes stop_codon:yes gene_type:complete
MVAGWSNLPRIILEIQMETIKVIRPSKLGYAIINKSDFDPSKMTEYGKAPKQKAKAKAKK